MAGLKCNLKAKSAIFITAVAALTAVVVLVWFQVSNFELLWKQASMEIGGPVSHMMYESFGDIYTMINLQEDLAEGEALKPSEERLLQELEERYAADATNLRWRVEDAKGTLRRTNAERTLPETLPGLHEWTAGPDGEGLNYFLWLDTDMEAEDQYREIWSVMSRWEGKGDLLLALTVLCALLGAAAAVICCVLSGHKAGVEGIHLMWLHRLPTDLLLVVYGAGVALGLAPLAGAFHWVDSIGWEYLGFQLAAVAGVGCFTALLAVSGLVTAAVRCKAGTLLRNTIVWRALCWCGRVVMGAARAVPLIWKAAAVAAAYLPFSLLTMRVGWWNELMLLLWLAVTVALAGYLCLWAWQWKTLRRGVRRIIGGDHEYRMDTRKLLPDLKGHAQELNSLGQTINAAVDDRLKSEHFKAELITNVSHDLKTPLTSIINYVDLLKKEELDNPKAAEYIEVLDRKSQRLKKLTEDLVEASKASTGALAVARERLDLVQLAVQAVGEYEERLAAQRLTVVRSFPAQPVWVEADGRHLWRVIDNLLSNCAKYALEGTRVYVDIWTMNGRAALSIKNISREELNVPPELLVERFVRGDESRATEGSGLGLSIAQSLTDLQQGAFAVSIDGDLFKATVTLPLADSLE